jgi:transposase
MQGRNAFETKTFFTGYLAELVPKEDFYRKLNVELDLHWLYAHTACYYGTGEQESIDTVVFFKIYLVGYLSNICSGCQLMAL